MSPEITSPIAVIGVTDGGPESLPNFTCELIAGAEVLVGGQRHLELFGKLAPNAEQWRIRTGIDELVPRIAEECRQVVVIASGDPGFYGIGAALRRAIPAERLRTLPNVTSVQLAFAAIAEPWQDAVVVSAHGRPAGAAINAVLHHRQVAVLTDGTNTPAALAAQFLEVGVPDCRVVVCERLGGKAAMVTDTRLSLLRGQEFDPLNVLLVLQEEAPEEQPFGLEEEEVDHRAGMITKLEVRAAAVARLRLRRSSVAWDIGSGSGSVALEMARLCPSGQIYAVDRDREAVERVRANARRRRCLIDVTLGEAPGACEQWPGPDAVFLGGGGADLPALIQFCSERLRPGGRIAASIATLETLHDGIEAMRGCGLGPHVSQICVSRSQPIARKIRLAALNPVFVLWGIAE